MGNLLMLLSHEFLGFRLGNMNWLLLLVSCLDLLNWLLFSDCFRKNNLGGLFPLDFRLLVWFRCFRFLMRFWHFRLLMWFWDFVLDVDAQHLGAIFLGDDFNWPFDLDVASLDGLGDILGNLLVGMHPFAQPFRVRRGLPVVNWLVWQLRRLEQLGLDLLREFYSVEIFSD